jgi:hypothetical protein
LSRKVAKSRALGRKLRSTGTKERTGVSPGRNALAKLQGQLEARTRELAVARDNLAEALEQQTATSEVLRAISTARTDVQPVFETIVRNAVSLCGSQFANVFRFDGELLHFVASKNVVPSYVGLLKTKYPMRPDRSQVSGRVVLTKSIVRLEDVVTDPDYDQRFPQLMVWRRMLGVPLLREGSPIGVIVVGWSEAGPISNVHEDLLKTFADQAVIAIENARLFDEVQARTRELSEALEQQTATGEILASISGSVTDTKPVFDAIVRNLRRLLGTRLATVLVLKDGMVHLAAASDELEFERLSRQFPRPLDETSGGGRAMLSKQVLQFAPVLDNPAAPVTTQRAARELGFNAAIFSPMIREDKVFGAIATARGGA